MAKKKVNLIDFPKPLKQYKSQSCVVQPNFLVPFLMNNRTAFYLSFILKIKTNLKLAYAVYCACALPSDIIKNKTNLKLARFILCASFKNH